MRGSVRARRPTAEVNLWAEQRPVGDDEVRRHCRGRKLSPATIRSTGPPAEAARQVLDADQEYPTTVPVHYGASAPRLSVASPRSGEHAHGRHAGRDDVVKRHPDPDQPIEMPFTGTTPWLMPTKSEPTTTAICATRRRFGPCNKTASASEALAQVGGELAWAKVSALPRPAQRPRQRGWLLPNLP